MNVDLKYQPQALAGILIEHGPDGVSDAGSCFALEHPDVFVTAAHCIQRGHLYDVWTGTHARKAGPVVEHPSADLAVLRVEPDPGERRQPFALGSAWPAAGDECGAFGWSGLLAHDNAPPASALFAGPFQDSMERAAMYEHAERSGLTLEFTAAASRWRFDDEGAVIGTATRSGQSGGPVFAMAAPTVALGLVSQDCRPPWPREPFTYAVSLSHYADWIEAAAIVGEAKL